MCILNGNKTIAQAKAQRHNLPWNQVWKLKLISLPMNMYYSLCYYQLLKWFRLCEVWFMAYNCNLFDSIKVWYESLGSS